jgi:hypothetical protein
MPSFAEPDERLSVLPADQLPATPLAVTFYPTVDDMAYIALRLGKSYKFPARAQYALQAFLALNLAGLPFALWYFGEPMIALATFVLSVIFAALFLPALLKADYRHYFQAIYGSVENSVMEVVLTEDGVWCRHENDHSFFAWTNIKELEETKTSIYFFLDYKGFAVAKTGFAYDEEKDRFLSFAKARVRAFNTV